MSNERYTIGAIVSGKIINLKPYGAFVHLENGQEGLLHISEISEKYVKDINQYLHVGDVLELQVIDADQTLDFLRFSLKRLQKTPIKKSRSHKVRVTEIVTNFAPLAEKLPDWIVQAQGRIKNRK